MNKLEKLVVGEKHPNSGVMIRAECTAFDGFYCPLTLTIMMPSITEKEIESIKSGKCHFSAKNIGDILMFYLYVDGLYFETPFNINLFNGKVDFSEYEITSKDQGYLLSIVLVDTESGIIKALRAITLSNKTSSGLLFFVKKQYSNKANFNKIRYEMALDDLYFSGG